MFISLFAEGAVVHIIYLKRLLYHQLRLWRVTESWMEQQQAVNFLHFGCSLPLGAQHFPDGLLLISGENLRSPL